MCMYVYVQGSQMSLSPALPDTVTGMEGLETRPGYGLQGRH